MTICRCTNSRISLDTILTTKSNNQQISYYVCLLNRNYNSYLTVCDVITPVVIIFVLSVYTLCKHSYRLDALRTAYKIIHRSFGDERCFGSDRSTLLPLRKSPRFQSSLHTLVCPFLPPTASIHSRNRSRLRVFCECVK